MSTLRTAARLTGILDSYVDQFGRVRETSDETRSALLGAMGFEAGDEAGLRRSIEVLDARERRILPPVRVVRASEAWDRTIRFRIPDEWTLHTDEQIAYECELEDDHGERTTYIGTVARGGGEVVDIGLAPLVDPGYYQARLVLRARGATREGEQSLVIAPSSCIVPAQRRCGIVANLYSIRSTRNWGVGHLGDLGTLAAWSAKHGAAFVGINPLHATRNRGTSVSPYGPVSRLYRSEAYLDVEAVPELAESDEARVLLEAPATRAAIAAARDGNHVAYEVATTIARPILEAMHRTFAERHRDGGDPRGRAYAAYTAAEGESLTHYATFRVLEEHHAPPGAPWRGWPEWPAPYRAPHSAAVAEFRQVHREQVDFHRWMQFELDRQLGEAAARGRRAGLSIGLYQDLAIGSAADGSDAWAHQALFVRGASLGAPPDDYAAHGQNWGLPPLDPHVLHEDRYAHWIALLRAALRHGGALRLDHVLGLFRQFWIPDGMDGPQGAYVRFPANDLLGILALEGVRHQAIIVGEDLGTVPPEVRPAMRDWGILGSRVLFFERDGAAFRPAAQYEPLALATADTHDMVPLAGYWEGRDITLRREFGLIASDAEENAARVARDHERGALIARLAADGAIAPGEPEPEGAALRGAVHRFLCETRSLLVGISLDDLTGEREPVNVPGVGPDRFASWSRRMRLPLEALDGDAGVARAMRCGRDRGAGDASQDAGGTTGEVGGADIHP